MSPFQHRRFVFQVGDFLRERFRVSRFLREFLHKNVILRKPEKKKNTLIHPYFYLKLHVTLEGSLGKVSKGNCWKGVRHFISHLVFFSVSLSTAVWPAKASNSEFFTASLACSDSRVEAFCDKKLKRFFMSCPHYRKIFISWNRGGTPSHEQIWAQIFLELGSRSLCIYRNTCSISMNELFWPNIFIAKSIFFAWKMASPWTKN